MSSQLVRVASFATWPSTAAVSSLVLARAGFKYTGHGESTVCTECQLVIDRWQQGDLPDQVHRQRSPNCAFVREHLQASDSSISRAPAVSVATERLSHNDDLSGRVSGLTTTDYVTGPVNRDAGVHGIVASHLPSSCAINRDYPDYERLKNEEARLSTFYDWPERAARIVEPHDLVRTGMFYTGQTDRVQCAFCRGYLRNWAQGDRPADEHRRHFPNCSFLTQQRDVPGGYRANLTAFSDVDVSVVTITVICGC